VTSGLRQRDSSAWICVLAVLAGALSCSAQNGMRNVKDKDDAEVKATGPGSYYALVVGIDGYRALPKLKTPINDAKEVASVLESQYGFKTQLLMDPTRDQIFSALAGYQSLTDADNLLIYYAGHGYYLQPGALAYWIPVDADPHDFARWIDAAEIAATARSIPARHVLVISDSCFAGMLASDIPAGAISAAATSDSGTAMTYVEKLALKRSRTLLASGDNEPVPDEDATDEHFRGHSRFANAILDDFYQMPDDQFTGEQLSLKLRVQLSGSSNQTPVYRYIEITHDDGDFVFVRVVKRANNVDPQPTADIHSWKPETYVAPNPDKGAVTAALDNYEQAYSSMDLHELKKAWPSLSKSQEKEIKEGFESPDLRAVRVELRNRSMKIDGTTAVADCDQWMTYTFAGRKQPPQTSTVEIELAKNDHGDWAVSGVRAR
jgi:hypothetical protein